MTIGMFTFVDLYRRVLDTADHLLDKGAEFAAGQGVDESEMLGWRLADDMYPLGFQVMVVVNFTRQWPARAAGLAAPAEIGDDLDIAGFKAAIAEAKAFLDGLSAEQFEGRDEAPVTFKIGDEIEPTMPAARWLSVFSTTNVYFHLSMIYAILRMKGIQIGKRDLFASGI